MERRKGAQLDIIVNKIVLLLFHNLTHIIEARFLLVEVVTAIPTPPKLFPIPTEGRRKYDSSVIVIIVIPFDFLLALRKNNVLNN